MDSSVLHFLKQKDAYRESRLANIKKTSTKLLRLKKKHALLKRDETAARIARAKRAGKYKRGMNLDGDDDEEDGTTTTSTPHAKKKSRKDVVCPLCGGIGHSTARSKHCREYMGPGVAVGGTTDATTKQEDEEDEDDGAQDTDHDLDLFFDVGTWSEDEDEHASSCFI